MAHLDHVTAADATRATALRHTTPAFAVAVAVFALTTSHADAARAQMVDVPATQVDTGSRNTDGSTPAHTDALPASTLRDTPTSATRLEPARFVGRGLSVGDMLEHAAGVQLRRFGGLGSPTQLSIRGLGGNHVSFVLDDQPLYSATQGPIDLGLLPLPLVDHIEVYRGAGPSRFQSPIGGVVRLVSHVPRDRFTLQSSAGYGSQHTRSAHIALGTPITPHMGTSLFLAYQGSAGDFPFYDDRGTPYNVNDDQRTHRQNNAFDALVARWIVEGRGPKQSIWQFSSMGTWHTQGIPGPGAQQTEHTHAREWFGTARLMIKDVALLKNRLLLSHGVDVQHNARQFRDPDLEAGLTIGRSSHARLTHAGIDGRVQWLPSLAHVLEWSPRVDWSGYDQSGNAESPSLRARALHQQRWQLGMGLEHRWEIIPRLLLAPVVRFDSVWDVDKTKHNQQQISPRIGASYRIGMCRLRTSGGRFHRFASLFERFGDATITIPNPSLNPEHGWSGDGGVDCAWQHTNVQYLKHLRYGFDIAGFGTYAQQLIVLVQTAQQAFQAQNIGKSIMGGVESRFDLQVATWFSSQVNYTWTHARVHNGILGEDNTQTPGIPQHRITTTLWLGPAFARVGYGIDAMTQAYLDRANLQPIPARVLHHLYADVAIPKIHVTVRASVRNVADSQSTTVDLPGAAPGTKAVRGLNDFIGYPLAGRTWFVSVLWQWRRK